MSKINLNNYEAFMLDYLEGKLSIQDILALKAFALKHPDLDLDFDEQLVTLDDEENLFGNKQNLKVNFNDELVIGYLENNLVGEEKQKAEGLALTNRVFQKELSYYKNTIAIADTSVVFENKALLKHEPKIIAFTRTSLYRIAAALLLLLGLWLLISPVFLNRQTKSDEIVVRETKEKILPSPTTKLKMNPEENVQLKRTAVQSSKNNHQTKRKTNVPMNLVHKEEDPVLISLIKDTVIKKEGNIVADTNRVKLTQVISPPKNQKKYIIEEGNDDELTAAKVQPRKNKFWNFASKALKTLNQNGLDKVNGSANDDQLVIGSLSISRN